MNQMQVKLTGHETFFLRYIDSILYFRGEKLYCLDIDSLITTALPLTAHPEGLVPPNAVLYQDAIYTFAGAHVHRLCLDTFVWTARTCPRSHAPAELRFPIVYRRKLYCLSHEHARALCNYDFEDAEWRALPLPRSYAPLTRDSFLVRSANTLLLAAGHGAMQMHIYNMGALVWSTIPCPAPHRLVNPLPIVHGHHLLVATTSEPPEWIDTRADPDASLASLGSEDAPDAPEVEWRHASLAFLTAMSCERSTAQVLSAPPAPSPLPPACALSHHSQPLHAPAPARARPLASLPPPCGSACFTFADAVQAEEVSESDTETESDSGDSEGDFLVRRAMHSMSMSQHSVSSRYGSPNASLSTLGDDEHAWYALGYEEPRALHGPQRTSPAVAHDALLRDRLQHALHVLAASPFHSALREEAHRLDAAYRTALLSDRALRLVARAVMQQRAPLESSDPEVAAFRAAGPRTPPRAYTPFPESGLSPELAEVLHGPPIHYRITLARLLARQLCSLRQHAPDALCLAAALLASGDAVYSAREHESPVGVLLREALDPALLDSTPSAPGLLKTRDNDASLTALRAPHSVDGTPLPASAHAVELILEYLCATHGDPRAAEAESLAAQLHASFTAHPDVVPGLPARTLAALVGAMPLHPDLSQFALAAFTADPAAWREGVPRLHAALAEEGLPASDKHALLLALEQVAEHEPASALALLPWLTAQLACRQLGDVAARILLSLVRTSAEAHGRVREEHVPQILGFYRRDALSASARFLVPDLLAAVDPDALRTALRFARSEEEREQAANLLGNGPDPARSLDFSVSDLSLSGGPVAMSLGATPTSANAPMVMLAELRREVQSLKCCVHGHGVEEPPLQDGVPGVPDNALLFGMLCELKHEVTALAAEVAQMRAEWVQMRRKPP